MIYDPYSRPFQEDPYPLYKHFRDEDPCTYNAQKDFYALFRFEDVWNATLDWETISSSLGPVLENRGQVPPGVFSIIGMDPPAHTKLRNVISRGFTPRRIAALEAEIRGIAKNYLEPLAARDAFDFEQEFAVKFPMDVISALLGIPEEDREAYRHGIDQGLNRDPDAGLDPANALNLVGSGQQYMARQIEQRRKQPREDLITVLADAEYEDETGVRRRLTDQECTSFLTLLAAAGAETTAKLLGHAVYLLWKHPDQRQYLWDDPARIPNAIEEILRYEAPSPVQGRVVTHDVDYYGRTVPAGGVMVILNGSANRDDRAFPDGDRFDIRRTITHHLSFGYGIHFCLGAALARLEGRIALDEVLNRFPTWDVDWDGAIQAHTPTVRGWEKLPVVTT